MNRAVGDSCLVAVVCFFGSWTVYCYAMVLSVSSFSDLMAWSFVPIVAALGIWAVCTGRSALVDTSRIVGKTQPVLTSGPNSGALWALPALIISALTLRLFDIHYWPVWLVSVLCASILVVRTASTSAALVSTSHRVQYRTGKEVGASRPSPLSA